MESNMVDKDLFDNNFFLSYSDAKEVVCEFLNSNMNYFNIKEDENLGMFFHLKFEFKNYSIYLLSDRGSFSYRLTEENNEINLFQFEPLLSNVEWFSRKNILFVLSTIKKYIESREVV